MSAIEVLDREQYPVDLCDERIRQAHHVLENPDDHTRREFFDARRDVVRWTRRKEVAVAWDLVREAAKNLFEFARPMPGFWQHELTSAARQTFIGGPFEQSLEDDAPFTQCDRCHRKSWSLQDGRCSMVQPDGTRCQGTMRP